MLRSNSLSAVAVLAFKTVLKFEMTRRQNDKRIMLVQVKMNDMLSVLLMCVVHLLNCLLRNIVVMSNIILAFVNLVGMSVRMTAKR